MKDEQSHSRSESAKLRGEQNSPRRLSFLQASVAVMLTLAVIAAIVIPFLDESLLDRAELSARSFLGDADAIATVEANAQASSTNTGLQQIAGPVYARPGATGTPLQEAEAGALPTPTVQLAPGAIQLPTATPQPEEEVALEASPTLVNSSAITPTISPTGVAATAALDADEAAPAEPLDTASAILNADNVLVSADADVLHSLLRDNEYAIGLLDHAFLADDLRVIGIELPDGREVEPSLNSVSQGAYPLTHTLYLYTTGATLQNNPTVTAFMGCYLVHVQEEWAASGVYPADRASFENSLALYEVMTGYAEGQLLRSCLTADDSTASVNTRSTDSLMALTQAIAEQAATNGFASEVQIEAVTSEEGLMLCARDAADATASDAVDLLVLDAPLPDAERALCEEAGLEPLEFAIGRSAATLVVSADNAFADSVTIEEAYALLSTAASWSDVRSTWPDAPIARAVADPQSGTFATFVAAASAAIESQLAAATAVAAPAPTTGVAAATAPDILTPTVGISGTNGTNVSDVGVEDASTTVITSTTDVTETVGITSPTTVTATDAIAAASTSTATLSATPAPESPVMPSGDLVLGIVEERDICAFVSDVLIEVFLERFELEVATVPFATIQELYVPLLDSAPEDGGVDITLCQMDPADRELLRIEGDAVSLIGSTYASDDNQRYLVVANADAATALRREQSCAYEFLSRMDFGELSVLRLEPTEWLAQNSELIDEWALCDSEE